MTREELLDKLHGIRIGAQPIVITNDMGLQYEYVTPKGYGTGFGNMGDWPAYRLQHISNEKLQMLQEKIRNRTLTVADLEDTDLTRFYGYVFAANRPGNSIPDLCDFMAGLLTIESTNDGILYALCDAGQWDPEVHFFATYEDLESAFEKEYANLPEEWESFSSNELADFWDRIRQELDCIPFVILDD